MSDESAEPTGEGEIVPPIMPYEPEPVEPGDDVDPPGDDIDRPPMEGPSYPTPGGVPIPEEPTG
ncbi:hypothetical protein [Streptomyces albipurpureus]|uniref:Uncharacterized protein n=1 Tax=Streptomyces albipurpureus TaxID=2897419 RepID=A0ABT0UT32_9ACTN|nr:hypothetical protein [Streptomyces sp. CWNU-1]MCM2391713.1 hypothetical protein [Streptomyces sp. CWNU-1]